MYLQCYVLSLAHISKLLSNCLLNVSTGKIKRCHKLSILQSKLPFPAVPSLLSCKCDTFSCLFRIKPLDVDLYKSLLSGIPFAGFSDMTIMIF